MFDLTTINNIIREKSRRVKMYSVDAGLLAENIHALLKFDEDGFLLQAENWDHEIAQQIAQQNGVPELEAKHLNVVQFIRDYYFELGGFVTPRRICSEMKVDKVEMKRFFGSCTNAWKIAGLPNPGEEAKTYMN